MIRNTVLASRTYYYPLGNTPAVSLTQDLPPEQDADILLLGCGDVRNILFTCFADAARKIDVTCCDIEPGIHARNILLYTLLIEDEKNLNLESTWNIYFHWKLDKNSVELLETQSRKLSELSKSIDEWHASVYGSTFRFCDERSLSLVRAYWVGFRLQGSKKDRQSQLQSALDKAKALRAKMVGKNINMSDLRATSPILGPEAITDLSKVAKMWWDCGTTPLSGASAVKAVDLNPAFLFSPNPALMLHYGLSPIVGFPLSTAYVPVTKESPLHRKWKGASSPEHLVESAKSHFAQWASAFRKSVKNKSVIRIFCGDALAFCCTLRHCQLTMPTPSLSMNVFCDNWNSNTLSLHHGDYGSDKNHAPLRFDVIDTSNLVDHLGPLNMIAITSSLLKYRDSSSLYTEMLVQHDPNVTDRLSGFFGVDTSSMALLFGLVLPDLFTNAVDSFDYDLLIDKLRGSQSTTQIRSRLRWRRLRGCKESGPCVRVEAKSLAMLLNQVHDAMFSYEDPTSMLNPFMLSGPSAFAKQANLCYNRASFAFLLNLLRATVDCDWDQCIAGVYSNSFCLNSLSSIKTNCAQDLLLQMQLNGIDNGEFDKPAPVHLQGSILAPVLPLSVNEHVPDQLCVTVRVSREKLRIFTERDPDQTGTPALVCNFSGGDPTPWENIFSSVQITYGKWRERTDEGVACPFIEEDRSQLLGTSDLFISVYVPTLMLLQSKQFVPLVKCGFMRTAQNFMVFMREFGPDLCLSSNKLTDKDVFVTRYMPGMSALPTFAVACARSDDPAPGIPTLRLTSNGSKVDTVIQRLTLERPAAKAKLAERSSTVEIEFKSPLVAFVSIEKSVELKFEFPVPVSPSKHKVRIARKSSYIEVETPLFNPLEENAAFFIFPTFTTKVACGTTIPMAWTSTRIDLDTMPPIDVHGKHTVSLSGNASLMFSDRERRFRESKSGAQEDVRTDLKDVLFSIIVHFTGEQGQLAKFFGLGLKVGGNQTLLFPSCIRLDLLNRTFLLDTAIIPLTETMFDDPRATRFFQELTNHGFYPMKVSEDVNRAWKALMPTWVERCRTFASWKHTSNCEYIQAGEVPLTKGVNEEGVSPICSCGMGKFPSGDYLKSEMKKLPELSYMISRYATRAAIGPIFVVPYVENCAIMESLAIKETCVKCGKSKREGVQASGQGLLACSRCKSVKYCSKECQKADWKYHKPTCVAA